MKVPLLGYALLGLLHGKPRSGYELRKVFASTPMGNFSDSPGAIYPALRDLERRGLIRGRVEDGATLRKKKVFSLTRAGKTALKSWLAGPVTRRDLARDMNALMLRYAFMDSVIGMRGSVTFLQAMQQELSIYIRELSKISNAMGQKSPLSARLALQNGIIGYKAQRHWAKAALAAYRHAAK